jgi:HPt (histidine-containing phosphotransfer) domain-containing protein
MTALSDPNEVSACLDAGMDECLSKPLERKLLLELLEQLTGGVWGAGSTTCVRTKTAPILPKRGPDTFTADLLLLRLDGNTALADRVIAEALVEISSASTLIARANAHDDAATMATVVHRLHGVLADLGAAQASTLAAEIERAARRDDIQAARRALDRLDKELACLSTDLSRNYSA